MFIKDAAQTEKVDLIGTIKKVKKSKAFPYLKRILHGLPYLIFWGLCEALTDSNTKLPILFGYAVFYLGFLIYIDWNELIVTKKKIWWLYTSMGIWAVLTGQLVFILGISM